MKTKTETKLVPDCHRGTKLSLVTAPGYYSRFNSLEPPLILEHKHEVVTAIQVEVFSEYCRPSRKKSEN